MYAVWLILLLCFTEVVKAEDSNLPTWLYGLLVLLILVIILLVAILVAVLRTLNTLAKLFTQSGIPVQPKPRARPSFRNDHALDMNSIQNPIPTQTISRREEAQLQRPQIPNNMSEQVLDTGHVVLTYPESPMTRCHPPASTVCESEETESVRPRENSRSSTQVRPQSNNNNNNGSWWTGWVPWPLSWWNQTNSNDVIPSNSFTRQNSSKSKSLGHHREPSLRQTAMLNRGVEMPKEPIANSGSIRTQCLAEEIGNSHGVQLILEGQHSRTASSNGGASDLSRPTSAHSTVNPGSISVRLPLTLKVTEAPDEGAELTVDEQEVLEEMKKYLGEERSSKLPDEMFVRFVRGYAFEAKHNKWIEVACQEVDKTERWRTEIDASSLLTRNLPKWETFRMAWPTGVYGTDNQGHPIIVERFQDIDLHTLTTSFQMEELTIYQARNMEYVQAVKHAISKQTNHMVYKHHVIADMTGLSAKVYKAKDQMQAILQVAQYYYPETLLKLFVINAPFLFRAIWKALSPLVHPITKEKIKILGGAFIDELQENGISIDQIPPSIGGTFDVSKCQTILLP